MEIQIMKNRNITFTATLLVVACFALLPKSLAVNPPPDGGYAGGNTAEGQNALLTSLPVVSTRRSGSSH
jgi:hypothetical protein